METYTPGTPGSVKIELTATEVADIYDDMIRLTDFGVNIGMWQATLDLLQVLGSHR